MAFGMHVEPKVSEEECRVFHVLCTCSNQHKQMKLSNAYVMIMSRVTTDGDSLNLQY